MPHKSVDRLGMSYPDWVDEITDPCLSEEVKHAIVARHSAREAGALGRRDTRALFESADTTMEQIEYRRVVGRDACRKAAVALRKYSIALERAELPRRRSRF